MTLVYILEDEKDVREMESIALENAGHEVVSFGDAKGFFSALAQRCPDIALIDVMLPDGNGFDIVKKIRMNPAFSKLPVIMVTAMTTEEDMVKGLGIGADDYIKKPYSILELITRVNALLRRTAHVNTDAILRVDDVVMDNNRHMVYVADEMVDLTFREYELLRFLMNNSGSVVSRDEIMSKVWKTDVAGETRTVDVHIKALRHKMKNGGYHIKTVRNVGYVIE